MNMMGAFQGPASGKARMDHLAALQHAGLVGGLQLSVDAGDEASYSGSGGKWFDVSGVGSDVFIGTTAGAESSDPAFSGIIGARTKDCFLNDGGTVGAGGDCFNSPTSGGWRANISKRGGVVTMLAWVFVGSATEPVNFFTTTTGSFANGACRCQINTSNQLVISMTNAAASAFVAYTIPAAVGTGWKCIGFSTTWGNGLNILSMVNGVFSNTTQTDAGFNGTASGGLCLWATGTGGTASGASQKLASEDFYDGRALSQAEMLAYFENTRGRYGV